MYSTAALHVFFFLKNRSYLLILKVRSSRRRLRNSAREEGDVGGEAALAHAELKITMTIGIGANGETLPQGEGESGLQLLSRTAPATDPKHNESSEGPQTQHVGHADLQRKSTQ